MVGRVTRLASAAKRTEARRKRRQRHRQNARARKALEKAGAAQIIQATWRSKREKLGAGGDGTAAATTAASESASALPASRVDTDSTALWEAVKKKEIDTVSRLLDRIGKEDLNRTFDHDGLMITAFRKAVIEGDIKCVIAFLNKDPDLINQRGNHGCLPLISAAGFGRIEVMNELLEREANIHDQSNTFSSTALMTAIQYEKVDCVNKLLSVGASKFLRNRDGDTPLIIAAKKNNSEIVGLLLESTHNIDVDFADSKGLTPLHFAGIKDNLKIVQMLLGAGAKVNPKDNLGRTPLHMAMQSDSNDQESKLALCLKGAEIDCEDSNGYTPMDWALINNQKEAFCMLASIHYLDNNDDIQSPADVELPAFHEKVNEALSDYTSFTSDLLQGLRSYYKAKSRLWPKIKEIREGSILWHNLINGTLTDSQKEKLIQEPRLPTSASAGFLKKSLRFMGPSEWGKLSSMGVPNYALPGDPQALVFFTVFSVCAAKEMLTRLDVQRLKELSRNHNEQHSNFFIEQHPDITNPKWNHLVEYFERKKLTESLPVAVAPLPASASASAKEEGYSTDLQK